MNIDNQVTQIVQQVIDDITANIQQQVMTAVYKQISDLTSSIDLQVLFKEAMSSAVKSRQFNFTAGTIPVTAIDFSKFTFSGDSVKGGIIQNFGSTGIDDQSTACQLTIMDTDTVVENNLLARSLTVKGNTIIEGDLNVTGIMPESSGVFRQIVSTVTNNVRTSLDQVVFQNYADMVLEDIKTNGLDLNKITVNGQEVISGSNLGNNITFSNLQRIGALQELQVIGESFLGQTAYVSNKRVGINTIEPGQALSVWDQEVEIGMGKQGSNTGIIGTPRSQTLIVSTNGKNNIVLTPDGGTTVNQLTLGGMSITTSDKPPSTNQPRGSLVFNNNPTLGGPLGWVSLGDAKWANFGYID
jgi:DNA-binding cell septation regulator SpoVG